MREAGLVVEEKQGREHLQQLNGAALQPVADRVNRYEAFRDRKLAALKARVENMEEDR